MKSILVAFTMMVLCTGFTLPSSQDELPLGLQSSRHDVAGNIFGMFHAHRQGKGIALLWTITDPSQVSGFEIEKSYDGEFFDPAGSAACNNQSMMRYLDGQVFPGYVSYQIKAFLIDGSVQYSDVQTVRIVSRK